MHLRDGEEGALLPGIRIEDMVCVVCVLVLVLVC
jgi:hypothetical protein